jgi:hypothetical protein
VKVNVAHVATTQTINQNTKQKLILKALLELLFPLYFDVKTSYDNYYVDAGQQTWTSFASSFSTEDGTQPQTTWLRSAFGDAVSVGCVGALGGIVCSCEINDDTNCWGVHPALITPLNR